MVLAGSVNKEIVAAINAQGGKARRHLRQGRQSDAGRSGSSGCGATPIPISRRCWISASSASRPRSMPISSTSSSSRISSRWWRRSASGRTARPSTSMPTLSPRALATAMKAKRLLLLTDVEGVLDKDGQLIKPLTDGRGAGADRGRHDLRRHDPQDRELPGRDRRRRRGRGHPQRPRAACGPARALHRAWRRHLDRAAPAEERRQGRAMSTRPDLRERLRPCRELGVRPRQHPLSRRLQSVRRDRPPHGRVHRQLSSACRWRKPSACARPIIIATARRSPG